MVNRNRPWHIEQQGIDVIPVEERYGRPGEMFWVWFGANLGILGVIYGVILVAYGLNFWQSVLAMGLGLASFGLVGAFTVAGRDGGAPMMMLSRVVFGTRGNAMVAFLSWLSLVGWETIAVITASWAGSGLWNQITGQVTPVWGQVTLIGVVVGVTVALGLLGQATLVVMQKFFSALFGVLTLVIALWLLPGTHWAWIENAKHGPWLTGFVPAWSFIVAGTGLSWTNAAADYSRYVSPRVPGRRLFWAALGGGALPLVGLIGIGIFVGTRDPGLAAAANPILALGQQVPRFLAIPYLITVVGGLVAEADLSLYSSGLALLALDLPWRRQRTVLLDALLMILGTLYVVVWAHNFYAAFESFILLLGVGLAAWAGVFGADQMMYGRTRGYPATRMTPGPFAPRVRWEAVAGFGLGTVLGLMVTASPLFTGPWAGGIFLHSSLELVVAGVSAAVIYITGSLARRTAKPVKKTGENVWSE